MTSTLSIGELLNVVGLSTGVVLYAMLLVMVVRAGRTREGRSPFDPLLLVTAVLGLVWNLCALPAYELPKVGIEGPFPYLTVAGFGALGFLPAVVVHSVLQWFFGRFWTIFKAQLWWPHVRAGFIALVLAIPVAAGAYLLDDATLDLLFRQNPARLLAD